MSSSSSTVVSQESVSRSNYTTSTPSYPTTIKPKVPRWQHRNRDTDASYPAYDNNYERKFPVPAQHKFRTDSVSSGGAKGFPPQRNVYQQKVSFDDELPKAIDPSNVVFAPSAPGYVAASPPPTENSYAYGSQVAQAHAARAVYTRRNIPALVARVSELSAELRHVGTMRWEIDRTLAEIKTGMQSIGGGPPMPPISQKQARHFFHTSKIFEENYKDMIHNGSSRNSREELKHIDMYMSYLTEEVEKATSLTVLQDRMSYYTMRREEADHRTICITAALEQARQQLDFAEERVGDRPSRARPEYYKQY